MVIRTFDGAVPDVHETAYVDETAVVVGDVAVERRASVWPNAALRGDRGRIVLREGSNVQDNAVCHENVEIGPYATVGHGAVVHGATVRERALVGMNAVVLERAEIGTGSIVAAGSVVTEDTTVPSETLIAGSPAEALKEIPDASWTEAADRYVELASTHERTAERVDRT